MSDMVGLMRQRRDRIEHADVVWVLVDSRPFPLPEDTYVDSGHMPVIEELPWLEEMIAASR